MFWTIECYIFIYVNLEIWVWCFFWTSLGSSPDGIDPRVDPMFRLFQRSFMVTYIFYFDVFILVYVNIDVYVYLLICIYICIYWCFFVYIYIYTVYIYCQKHIYIYIYICSYRWRYSRPFVRGFTLWDRFGIIWASLEPWRLLGFSHWWMVSYSRCSMTYLNGWDWTLSGFGH